MATSDTRNGCPRQRIGPFVLGMPGMAPDPVPFHVVGGRGCLQPLPEFGVLDRLAGGGLPAVPLPVGDPLGDPVSDVLAVGVDSRLDRALQALEAFDCGHQLHAVVCGLRGAARELFFGAAPAQDRAPAAGARVSRACPVGVDVDDSVVVIHDSPQGSRP